MPSRSDLMSHLTSLRSRPLRLAALFGGVLLPLFICAHFADEVLDRDEMRFDNPILLNLHGRATPTRDAIFLAITRTGNAPVVLTSIAVLIIALIGLKRRRAALFVGLSCGGSAALNVLVKLFFQRDRPALWLSIAPEYDYSFPSGHAMLSMSLAATCVLLAWPTRWRWPVAAVGAIYTGAIGLSRLYLGVHFPSDVLAGWCAGLAWTIGAYFILRGQRDGYFQSDQDGAPL